MSSCNPEPEVVEELCTISYDNDIAWILDVACTQAGCHNSGSANGDMTQYDSVRDKVDNGSLWFRVLVTKSMPPGIKLDSTQLNAIQVWIEEGAKDN